MTELDIERDDRFVANERRIHRVAVVAMTLLVLGGALGVFGVGPLASTTRQDDASRSALAGGHRLRRTRTVR